MLFISFGSGNEMSVTHLERLNFACVYLHTSISYSFLNYFTLFCYLFFQSSASIVPQLWQPSSGALMSNDSSDAKSAEEPAACIALSKNDSYVMSASGGKVSLFNMMTFKVCCSPPFFYLGNPYWEAVAD